MTATWLPMPFVLEQVALRELNIDHLVKSISAMVISIAVRHGDSPSEIAVSLADVFPQGEQWELLSGETGRVLDAVKRGEG